MIDVASTAFPESNSTPLYCRVAIILSFIFTVRSFTDHLLLPFAQDECQLIQMNVLIFLTDLAELTTKK